MQEFAAGIRPELMQQVHAGIAQERKADARRYGVHALALTGNVKIGHGTRGCDTEDARRIHGLAAAISTRNQHAAHGIERALEERQIRIAEISGVLLEQRRKKKALEENVSLIGSQVDAVGLALAAEAGFIFPIQMLALGAVGGFVDGGIGEGARRIGAVKKYVELLPRGERLPLRNQRDTASRRWRGSPAA